ncbi:hypothetical protein EGJ48_03530 [Pantoea dispersa]|uniref:hypothetical protein n=1 Tax=Pantoea dispersa TaxID=59814 RepID=UPI000F689A06|nr:hypothetical protein [Pantoea dispersa]RRW77629.1 hypothetical protein EGJ48_03530 [Pantoea dispersa]
MAQTDIKLGRYVISVMPVFFMLTTAFMCTQFQNVSDSNASTVDLALKVQKENSDLTRRIAATELRAREAEKRNTLQPTPSAPGGGVNVIIISPDGKAAKSLPSKSYADLNYPL